MAYLSADELAAMGFAQLGRNVLISSKASIYEPEKMHIGDNCRIDDFCVVSGKLTLGRNVYIGPFGLIAGGNPGITFEDFVTLAYRVQIFSQSDDYSGSSMANPTIPSEFKNEIKQAVRLCRHSIVGAGSSVMPGVTLAEGTSVGAASLVTKSTTEWSIYIGSPARKLKERSRDVLVLEQAYLDSEGAG